MRFELNRGQTDSSVRFLSRGAGYSLFLTPDEAVLALTGERGDADETAGVVRMRLLGAQPNPKLSGTAPLPGVTNYILGNDPRNWVTNVGSYSGVRYGGVYPGVDAVYYGDDQGRLEYDFIVAPGADPSVINMSFAGAKRVRVESSGELAISTGVGELRQHRPTVYQEADGQRRTVEGRYVVNGGERVGFEIGAYDRGRPLVIDPVLVYSTYLGGGGRDEGNAIAVDSTGHTYVTGSTTSVDFPTEKPLDGKCGTDEKCDPTSDGSINPNSTSSTLRPDVFVTKLSPDGSELVYSTYFGGKDDDRGLGIAVDQSGNAYVAGATKSANFPVTIETALDTTCGSDGKCDFRASDSTADDPSFGHTKADAFLVKLDPAGIGPAYSTYLGGSGDEMRPTEALYRLSSSNPTEPGDPFGAPPTSSGAIAVIGETAFVAGSTLSPDLRTTPNASDNDCGTGGNGDCNRFYCDYEQACPPASGNSQTNDPQGMLKYFPDAFLAGIDTSRSKADSLEYSSYFGGSGSDAAHGVAVVPTPGQVRAYITGGTSFAEYHQKPNPLSVPPVPVPYPTTPGAFQTEANRGFNSPSPQDAFVTAVDPERPVGSMVWSSLLGGWKDDDVAYGLATDASGTPYVTGFSESVDDPTTPNRDEGFPTTSGSFQPRNTRPELNSRGFGDRDAFMTKFKSDGTGLMYSTFIGGEGQQVGASIAVDAVGDGYVTGSDRDAFRYDGFVKKLRPNGAGADDLGYSVDLGGVAANPSSTSTTDEGRGIAVSGEAAHVTGVTFTSDFPLEAALQFDHGGVSDAFVTKLAPNLARPQITEVSPGEGNSSGGTEVVISGSNLGGTTAVRFGAISAAPIDVKPDGTQLRVMTPPGHGVVHVEVTTGTGRSARSSAAVFSYHDGAWEPTETAPEMAGGTGQKGRAGHTATLLDGPECRTVSPPEHCGKVLMVGGFAESAASNGPGANDATATSAVLYDPAPGPGSGHWTIASCVVGAPNTITTCPHRFRHTATQLQDGSVLVVGGSRAPSSAQIYRPQQGTWEEAGTPKLPRQGHTATLLGDGRVLVVGGWPTGGVNRSELTAEIYDPKKPNLADRWSLTATPPRDERVWLHTATLVTGGSATGSDCLDCGKVLVVGGASAIGGDPASSSSAELYDPDTDRWTARVSLLGRYAHSTTSLTSGKLLIAGGISEVAPPPALGSDPTTGQPVAAAEVYDPSLPFDKAFSQTGPLLTGRAGHVALHLPDGRAMVVGGASRVEQTPLGTVRPELASAEIYDPVRGRWSAAAAMAEPRGDGTWPGGHSATVLSGPSCGADCGKVLVYGGLRKVSEGRPGDPACEDGLDNDKDGFVDETDPNCQSGQLPDQIALSSAELYRFGPYVSSIDPLTAPASGGTDVTIKGSGFAADQMTSPASVLFGSAPAQSFRVVSPTEIRAGAPMATDAEVVEVGVVVKDSGFATSPTPFTYTGLPGGVTDLAAAPVADTEIELSFTAPGTVQNVGRPAHKYVIKQSRSPITADNFEGAVSLCEGGVCGFSPTRIGVSLKLSVGGLTPETRYYYALRAMNDSGQLGPISNVAEVETGIVPPAAVSDLVATPVNEDVIQLSFSAPGSNGAAPPPASRFVVKQSLTPITEDDFDAATALCEGGVCLLSAAAVGDRLTLSVEGLRKGDTYHYRLRAMDAAGNLGPISNLATATPGCAAVVAGAGQVAYRAGYSLIGLPGGSLVPSQTPLYGWFDLGRGGRYSTQAPTEPVVGGRGYWAWFSCPRLVDVTGSGASATPSPLGAYRASMVGNPSATSPATVSGMDFAARWDGGLNGGAGGYRISSYQEPQTLAVGEGIWTFSYRDTTVSVTAR